MLLFEDISYPALDKVASTVERLSRFWWCKGMLFILHKDFGESMCEVSAKSVETEMI